MNLVNKLVTLRSDPAPTAGPVVSVVVTNRDGQRHLRRLLDGLERRTRYTSMELVVVDNGSRDGSLALLEEWAGPIQVIQNSDNRSFSAANNQGIRAATGELVLLANNDVDPIHPDWLGYMVDSLDTDVAAVGALLVYPRRWWRRRRPQHPNHTVQHRGVFFDSSQWGVRAVNAGAGGDPLAVDRPRRRDVPVVTAACLLARRSDLLADPFDETYWYGSEDWDLCLRLGQRGRVVVDERAVLFHHEFGTQDKYRSQAWLDRRTENHQWFNDLWGPALLRERRREATEDPAQWFYRGDMVRRVHVGLRRSQQQGSQFARLQAEIEDAGWELVTGRPVKCDLAIALDPPDDVQWFLRQDQSVAVVLDRVAKWGTTGAADAARLVLAPNPVVAARLDRRWGTGLTSVLPALEMDDQPLFADILARSRPPDDTMRIGVSTCAPDWERAQVWGDTHLARGLGRAFRRQGHEAVELIRDDWRGRVAASCDVVVHLRGLHRRPVARGQWNLLWIISHPDRLEPGETDDYDVVATASASHADHLTRELGRTVHFIPQAADADTFAGARYAPEFDDAVVFAGVGRHPHRRGPRWLLRSGRPFQLYGRHWHDFPEERYAVDDYIPNRELPDAYRSAAVVVADHHGSMRRQGFHANRLFDVLAAGGLVLSDDVEDLDDVFGDIIPTYATAEELDTWLDVLLADPARRRELARAGRQLVLSQHTLDHRAERFLALLDELPGPASATASN